MPDLKISQLTSATTPLAGTEVLPIVQSSTTVKVAVSDLTAGRSVSASALTASSGNLTFSGTAQRITGDFSNATVANRLAFQTSTANGNTALVTIPNGTASFSGWQFFNSTTPDNSAYLQVGASSTAASIVSGAFGIGTPLPMTFFTGSSERVRIDTSGNVAVGTVNAGTAGLSLSQNLNLSWEQSATESVPNLFRQTSSAALVMSVGYKRSATANGFASSFGSSLAKTAISLGTTAGAITFYTDTAATTAVGTDVTPTERMRIDSSGNVGIGTTSPGVNGLDVQRASGTAAVRAAQNDTGAGTFAQITALKASGANVEMIVDQSNAYVGTTGSFPLLFRTNTTERMRIDSSGNVVAGASAALATTATDGFLYVPTCAGTPTGTPAAITGMAPIVVDTTNNKLYFYSSGTWRDAGP